jgi:YfiH family protein
MIQPPVAGVAFGEAIDGNPRLDDAVRAAIATDLGIAAEWAWVRQVHGVTVAEPSGPGIGAEADAVITTDPNLPVAVSVADCLPVAVLAPTAAAMVHAGWRGTAGGVVSATITRLRDLGHAPHTIVIGPGIGSCCFEVGRDVAEQFPDHRSTTSWSTPSVDLVGAVTEQADGLDVVVASPCTHHSERFNSYRRDGSAARQFGVAWIPQV